MKERVYGEWAGNPKGQKEDKTKCIKDVYSGAWYGHQCTRNRGHGLDKLYCKQHAEIKDKRVRGGCGGCVE